MSKNSMGSLVLAAAEKAAYNAIVVWRMYYINILKEELGSAETYEHYLLDEGSVVGRYPVEMTAMFGVFVIEKHYTLPTLYWLPKHHKKYHIRHVLLLVLVHALLLSCLYFWPLPHYF